MTYYLIWCVVVHSQSSMFLPAIRVVIRVRHLSYIEVRQITVYLLKKICNDVEEEPLFKEIKVAVPAFFITDLKPGPQIEENCPMCGLLILNGKASIRRLKSR